jgi:TRAP-type uncharacterized transport system substrate-binding protein
MPTLRKDPVAQASPITTRTQVMLEIASRLATVQEDRQFGQAKIYLRKQGTTTWPVCLFASNTAEGIEAVVKLEADVAIVNPTTPLALAVRGKGPWTSPQPVRVLAVIPSQDQYVFAVDPKTGLETFEDIGVKKFPLRIALRGEADHCLHLMLDGVCEASGFSLADVKSWGGEARRFGSLPFPNGPKFQAMAKGEIDAIFDEASDVWIAEALAAGMRLLPLREATVKKLEAIGYRRALIEKAVVPALPADVLTVDFSGWPIFVREDADDKLVTQFCAALVERADRIPWQGEGPLPIGRMCLEAPDTPQVAPLHKAAERYWSECGYLR